MFGSTRSRLLMLLASQCLCRGSAWSLVDRLTGRATPRSLRRFATRRHATPDDNRRTSGTRTSATTPYSTKQDQRSMMDFIQQPMETTVGDAREGSAHLDPEDLEFVTTIVQAADGRKADDIVVLHVGNVSTLTSFLVLLSGNSRPQNQAIAAAIVKDVQERYALTPGGSGVPEGSAESGWMLLDYGNVMVHIMTPKSRLYYNVEGQWKEKGGIPVDMDHVLVPNQVETVSTDRMDDGFVAAEDDPFWS